MWVMSFYYSDAGQESDSKISTTKKTTVTGDRDIFFVVVASK